MIRLKYIFNNLELKASSKALKFINNKNCCRKYIKANDSMTIFMILTNSHFNFNQLTKG